MKEFVISLQKNKYFYPVIVLLLLLIGGFLRFYGIDWGAPFYFNPDERNIIYSVTQLNIYSNFNPHFFAYGSLPIYIIYFIGIITNHSLYNLNQTPELTLNVSFETAIIIGRVLSALFSTATILVLYRVARLLVSKTYALFAALLSTFSVGLIQYAHFGTYESYLTFFSLLLLYYLLLYVQKRRLRYFLSASVVIGILIALKISSLILLPVPLIIYIATLQIKKLSTKTIKLLIKTIPLYSIFLISVSAVIFILGNPFSLLDFSSFIGSMRYESGVATGSIPVFYTGTFYNTVPFLFQALYVFPFILNPVIAVLVIPSLITITILGVIKSDLRYKVIILFFFLLFIPQAVLFVKWTRYMIPTLPIIYLVITCMASYLQKSITKRYKFYPTIHNIILIMVSVLSIAYSLIFIHLIYSRQDTRVQAAEFASQTIPTNAPLLSEVYDLGIVPFNDYFSTITLFDFYALEDDPQKKAELDELLQTHDYIVVLSQRISKSRLHNPEKFPVGYAVYSEIAHSEKFKLLYTTPCDIWCTIIYMGDPINRVEDTTNVFDHPILSIYKINHDNLD